MDRARKRVATINYIEHLTGRSYPSNLSKNIFFIGLILAASGLVSPPIALAGGLIYAFSFVHPFHVDAKKLSKLLLQASVVGLGFGMDLQQVLQTGRPGSIYTAASISMALLLGWGLGRLLRVKQRISFLISAGTATDLSGGRSARSVPTGSGTTILCA